MKEKLDALRKRVAGLQSDAVATAADCDALLTEIDARSASVVDLDSKVEKLRVAEADLSKANKDLQDTQQRRASVEKLIADIKAKL